MFSSLCQLAEKAAVVSVFLFYLKKKKQFVRRHGACISNCTDSSTRDELHILTHKHAFVVGNDD